MRNTFVRELLKEARKDPSIILLTGDLGYGVIDEFASALPNQYINFGINEQSMMSAAGGLASQGLKPFVYSIGNFPTFRCMEQIRNDISFMNLDVTIVAVGAGLAYGTSGYSHHLIEDIGVISSLPNMSVYSPADQLDVIKAVKILLENNGPKYIRLGKGNEKNYTNQFEEIYPGVLQINGLTSHAIISTGSILSEVIDALKELKRRNFVPTVYSVCDLNAISKLSEFKKYEQIFTVEEHIIHSGFGNIVNSVLSHSNVQILNIGINRIESSFSGTQDYLREKYGLNAKKIASFILKNVN